MIRVNIDTAREMVHEVRRVKRAEEFKPLDIEATIPALAEAAEQQRQLIRDKHVELQQQIDEAKDTQTLKAILDDLG